MGAGLLSAVNLGLRIIGNLILISCALRYLGREQYGLFVLFQSIAMYLAMAELGVGQSVMNFQGAAFVRGDYAEISRILTTTFALNAMIVIPVWILSALCILYLPVDKWFLKDVPLAVGPVFKPFLLLTATLALIRVPLQVLPTTFLGLRESHLRQLVDVFTNLLVLLTSILTLTWGGGLLALILATHLASMLLTAASYPLVRMWHPSVRLARQFWTPALLSLLLSNSLFFFLANTGLLVQRLAGPLLAGGFASLAQVTQLFAVLTLFRVVGWSLMDILSQAILPYIIRFSEEGRTDRVLFFARLSTKVTFALAVTYSAVIWLFADVGIRFWLGPEMFIGYKPLACIIGSFLLEVLFLSTNNFMRSLNKHRPLAMVLAVYAILSLVFGVLGAKYWTPDDPLFGLCFGMFVASLGAQGVILPFVTNNWLRISWPNYLLDFILSPGLLAGSSALILLGFRGMSPDHIWNRGPWALSLLLALSLITWFLVLDREARRWMIGQLNRPGTSKGVE